MVIPGEMPIKKQKTVGEALRTKGRNPMELSNIKRKEVAMKREEEPIERRGRKS